MNFRSILLLLSGVVLNCCSAQLTGGGSSGSSSHYEDLSGYRPKSETDTSKKSNVVARGQKPQVENPVLNVNTKVDAVLDSIDRLNEIRKFVDGYTIQIYSGTNREDAMNAKKKIAEANEFTAVMQYNQPKFRVTTGSYLTRLDAQKDLVRIKRLFPNCILVPEKVPIK